MEPLRLDDWLRELQEVDRHAPEGFTRRDIESALDISEARANHRLRQWFKQGRVECVGRKIVGGCDGRQCYAPVYRVKKNGAVPNPHDDPYKGGD